MYDSFDNTYQVRDLNIYVLYSERDNISLLRYLGRLWPTGQLDP
jgi:hypothetical protein